VDPVTQGALGAAWAQPAARGRTFAAASVIGAASGMAPDLDLLIRSRTDPFLAVEFHRHFTHSLAFVPIGALICALLLYPLTGRSVRFSFCYGFSVLGFASHGLLDACTAYGTMLLWPFSDERVAWDLVAVVDPLFTLPLIAFVVLGALRRRARYALIGLVWCLAYLGLGQIQNGRAVDAAYELARSRGHAPERLEAKPTLGNLVLYKTIYAYAGRYYVDAVRVGFSQRIFEGQDRLIVDRDRDFPWLMPDMQQARDLDRFDWFADGFLGLDPGNPNRIVDLRYSLLPNSADGFWGIELDPALAPDAHAAYVTMRLRSVDEGRAFLGMLFR
jgi:inner membrane protein